MFRSEVIAQRSDRLAGDVAVAVPVRWQVIGYFLFGSVAVALLFLSLANYARVETATGTIMPDKGVSSGVPTRAGVIAALDVRDGQDVAAGAALATVRAEEDSADGRSTAEQVQAAVSQQDASLAAQMTASSSAADAQLRQLAAQRAGLAEEITMLESQTRLQRDLIASAQTDLDRARTVAQRGFISGRDLQVREEALLSRQQGLAQINQSLASKRAALNEASRSASQVAAQARAESANLSANRAQVAQQAANTAGSRAYVLRAPVAGRVTALTARIGQPATAQTPLMTIVPAGSVLRAELSVPSAAIGFVKPGQTVRLAIDAFPYQRFGTVNGRIQTVAASPVSMTAQNGSTVSVYPVIVTLDDSAVTAFGRREPLVSGMNLTARIVTEKQSLLQWLFEPLFAVRRR